MEPDADVNADLTKELETYLSEACVDEDADILSYWRTAEAWPNLRQVARSYHAIPAAQTASERSFSDAGNTVTDCRSCWGGEHVNELLVIRSFYK